jgi:hypothetical protein
MLVEYLRVGGYYRLTDITLSELILVEPPAHCSRWLASPQEENRLALDHVKLRLRQAS